ncbi:MAG: hypothetical protein J1F14_08150 [Treponema sp.]|nr:hypothetical protein [Treponema sp.]
MKRFTKVMAVFAALVLALAFVGCGNKVVSEWSSSQGSHITLYKDGSCDFSFVVRGETHDGNGTYEDKTKTTMGVYAGDIIIEGTTDGGKSVSASLTFTGAKDSATGIINGLSTLFDTQTFTKK